MPIHAESSPQSAPRENDAKQLSAVGGSLTGDPVQRQTQEAANNSSQVKQLMALQEGANAGMRGEAPVQRKVTAAEENKGGGGNVSLSDTGS